MEYTYDPLTRLTAAVTTGSTGYPQWGLSWSYDRYGNRLSQSVTAGSAYSNSLVFYDNHGTRVKKCLPNCTSPTSSTVYVFSGSKDIAEYDNGAQPASPSREYIYSGGQLKRSRTCWRFRIEISWLAK